jgi:TolA-binding protein
MSIGSEIMSDGRKDEASPFEAGDQEKAAKGAGTKPGTEDQADPSACAALAQAVAAAKKVAEGRRPASGEPAAVAQSESTSSPVGREMPRPSRVRRRLAYATVALIAGSGGWVAAEGFKVSRGTDAAMRRSDEAMEQLRRNQDDLVRLSGDVRTLKIALDTVKETVDAARSESDRMQEQVADKLGRIVAKPETDAVIAALAGLNTRLDRIEGTAAEPAARLSALSEHLDRIDGRIAAFAKSAPAAATVASTEPPQTGSIGDGKPTPRESLVDGWMLHEVYGGVALVEGRNGRLLEVAPGELVPGVGRVESIERRGKRWVVVTAKGLIGTAR